MKRYSIYYGVWASQTIWLGNWYCRRYIMCSNGLFGSTSTKVCVSCSTSDVLSKEHRKALLSVIHWGTTHDGNLSLTQRLCLAATKSSRLHVPMMSIHWGKLGYFPKPQTHADACSVCSTIATPKSLPHPCIGHLHRFHCDYTWRRNWHIIFYAKNII